MAAESFISEEVYVDVENSEITLSQLFNWFSNDFGSSQEELLLFLLPFCKGDLKRNLSLLLSGDRTKIKFNYSSYDWNLNVGTIHSSQQEFI